MPIVTHPLPLSISFWRLERAGRGDEKTWTKKKRLLLLTLVNKSKKKERNFVGRLAFYDLKT